MIDKLRIASDLRMAVELYTVLTVEEHMSGNITKEAEKAWKKVQELINQLAENV
jgi:hypothetical protein